MSSTTAQRTQRSSPSGISVLITGGGVGGLLTALELWRRGCDVRVLERTNTTTTAGDSFVIGPSALRMLKHWPEMKERHDQIAYEPMFAKYKHTGERLTEPIKMGALYKTKLSDGHPQLLLHSRPKFHDMLLEQLTKCGVQVEYGKEVVDYFENTATAKGGVVLKDGSKCEADLVVAADGLRGTSWNLVAGQPIPARSSGSATLRTAYPAELALQYPEVAERFQLEQDRSSIFQSWAGANLFGVFWRTDEQMMWIITHPDTGTAEESWGHRISNEAAIEILSAIPNWPKEFDRIIKATPPDSIVDWKLMWRDPQPKWTSPGGYVVQLGDAAHTFLPTSGNGGTQALEDAVSLAACIAIAGKGRVPDATRVHNLLRFERVSFIQAMGIARRDAKAASNNVGVKPKPPPIPGAWLMDHDPEEYAEENFERGLAHLVDGEPFQNTNRPLKVEYRPWTIDGLVGALDKGETTILDGDWS
ncbi:FAD/NAD(P)-binding domain-containing protein [Lindgomyces ingoldianus]|uniref:FAD/NAD(P)-binding domain-containing protein n=1 Tax=Lindgomyces ingoldianus TaxID=673940 RepID=A0ACB6QF08_9PLEO|nr:FAD/NAD(P)-binding domain-containing protein [Lindgomyces ingoldianus]KAF2464735.1 FAD/NAD(P)-binding domain-containing protein [Lindgomyces ingoldianus]